MVLTGPGWPFIISTRYFYYRRSPSLFRRAELSKPYVREVLETEVFPYQQSVTGQPLILPTFDLAFYPMVRGPYNYTTTGINTDGTLQNPKARWGGIFRGDINQ